MLSQFGPSTWIALLFGGLRAGLRTGLGAALSATQRYRRTGRLRAVESS